MIPKFRAFYKPLKAMLDADKIESINFETKTLGVYMPIENKNFHKLRLSDFELVQYTGLKDRNGNEIYEGDILRVRRPGRDQQTHYGDNIPLGEYTEPLEPIINEYKTVVKFIDGMFGCESESEDHLPLKWIFVDTFADNEDELKEMFSGGWGHRIFEGWEDDLEYLFEQYKVSCVEELIKYIGVEVIGNIHSNPELLEVNP